jgi:hypothetical protein
MLMMCLLPQMKKYAVQRNTCFANVLPMFCQCFANVLPMFCQGTTEDQPNYMVADCSYPSKNYIMTACYRNHGSAQHHPATMKCAGDEGL